MQQSYVRNCFSRVIISFNTWCRCTKKKQRLSSFQFMFVQWYTSHTLTFCSIYEPLACYYGGFTILPCFLLPKKHVCRCTFSVYSFKTFIFSLSLVGGGFFSIVRQHRCEHPHSVLRYKRWYERLNNEYESERNYTRTKHDSIKVCCWLLLLPDAAHGNIQRQTTVLYDFMHIGMEYTLTYTPINGLLWSEEEKTVNCIAVNDIQPNIQSHVCSEIKWKKRRGEHY